MDLMTRSPPTYISCFQEIPTRWNQSLPPPDSWANTPAPPAAETLDHIGLNACQIQTLSCGEDIIIVKYNLIYLIVKGDLEKEDSYDNDMHGLSYPSQHENDEADQPNNVVIYKDLEISTLFLKHE